MGRIMLNQLSRIVSDYFSLMYLSLRLGKVKALGLCPVDDGRKRYPLVIIWSEPLRLDTYGLSYNAFPSAILRQ